jgi:hypothetical protein
MDARGEELRRRIVGVWESTEGRKGRRYPRELRLDVGAWVLERRKAGARVEEVSAFFRLSNARLGRWVVEFANEQAQSKQHEQEKEDPVEADGGLVPVRVSSGLSRCAATVHADRAKPGGLVLVTPGGYSLAGLDLESAAALLVRVP